MNRACLGTLCVLITLSCDSDKPSPLLPTTPTTPTTPTVLLSSLVVQGPPPTVGPGETARVQALARFSDGSERDVAAEATWTSTQPQIATVEGGVITGRALGRTTIRANFMNRTSSLRIVIQPAGTFVLSGNVTEPGPVNVGTATVAVIGRSYEVTANSDGFYELFGVSGTFTVRITKPGYLDATRILTVMSDQRVDLEIKPISLPSAVAGIYRVTLTISPSCSVVPADHRTRTYTASIEQNSAKLGIQLHDASFVPKSSGGHWNSFVGKVIGSSVTFDWGFGGYYYYYYDTGIQEILSGGQILGIWGTMVGQSGQTISGNLVGGFSFKEGNRTRTCSASDSPIVFTRN